MAGRGTVEPVSTAAHAGAPRRSRDGESGVVGSGCRAGLGHARASARRRQRSRRRVGQSRHDERRASVRVRPLQALRERGMRRRPGRDAGARLSGAACRAARRISSGRPAPVARDGLLPRRGGQCGSGANDVPGVRRVRAEDRRATSAALRMERVDPSLSPGLRGGARVGGCARCARGEVDSVDAGHRSGVAALRPILRSARARRRAAHHPRRRRASARRQRVARAQQPACAAPRARSWRPGGDRALRERGERHRHRSEVPTGRRSRTSRCLRG